MFYDLTKDVNAVSHPPDQPIPETLEAKVEEIVALNPRALGIRLHFEESGRFHFKAGQAIRVFLKEGQQTRSGFYSIASPPQNPDDLELCVTVRDEGTFSRLIGDLKKGDKIQIHGPLGAFTLPETWAGDAVFLAAGSGVSPCRSMIKDLLNKEFAHRIYLIFGNREEADILYSAEWETLMKQNPKFKYAPVLSQPGSSWKGFKGYVQDFLQPVLKGEFLDKEFFVCGPKDMVTAVDQKLLANGVSPAQIHYERY